METARPFLKVDNLSVSYNDALILHRVSLEVRPQQLVALVGPNGAGKTTLLKAVGGLLGAVSGRIRFEGEAIENLPVWEVVRRGIVYVPEGMKVFPRMSVLENLEVGAYLFRERLRERLVEVLGIFPELSGKQQLPAGQLSGGEQRIVTLARGLMSGARVLLLDDPFLGLSPRLTRRFCDTFRTLQDKGLTLVIAGQHVRRLLNVAEAAYLVEEGRITLSGSGPELLADPHLQESLFDWGTPG